jgi:hypothetical protein
MNDDRVVMVVVMMRVPHNHDVMMVMMVSMTDLHRNLRHFGTRRLISKPCIVGFEQGYGIGNWIEQISIAGCWRHFSLLTWRGLCACHCRECCGCSQQAGDLLIHVFSGK